MARPTPLRVLVVDDNRDAADSTGELLALIGCAVRVCYDGFTALEDAKAEPPELCLFDLNMPGMDGDELALKMREALPGWPITFAAVTAMSNEESEQRTARAGFHKHLVKPVNPQVLLHLVES